MIPDGLSKTIPKGVKSCIAETANQVGDVNNYLDSAFGLNFGSLGSEEGDIWNDPYNSIHSFTHNSVIPPQDQLNTSISSLCSDQLFDINMPTLKVNQDVMFGAHIFSKMPTLNMNGGLPYDNPDGLKKFISRDDAGTQPALSKISLNGFANCDNPQTGSSKVSLNGYASCDNFQSDPSTVSMDKPSGDDIVDICNTVKSEYPLFSVMDENLFSIDNDEIDYLSAAMQPFEPPPLEEISLPNIPSTSEGMQNDDEDVFLNDLLVDPQCILPKVEQIKQEVNDIMTIDSPLSLPDQDDSRLGGWNDAMDNMLHHIIQHADLDSIADIVDTNTIFNIDDEPNQKDEKKKVENTEEEEDSSDEEDSEDEVDPRVVMEKHMSMYSEENDDDYKTSAEHDHTYTAKLISPEESRTLYGVETPSDSGSDVEIDVVNVDNRVLPTNPSLIQQEHIQRTVRTAALNTQRGGAIINPIAVLPNKRVSQRIALTEELQERRSNAGRRKQAHQPAVALKRKRSAANSYFDDDERREEHNRAERRRRGDLSNLFQDLRLTIPHSYRAKNAKQSILDAAVKCIEDQLNTEREYNRLVQLKSTLVQRKTFFREEVRRAQKDSISSMWCRN